MRVIAAIICLVLCACYLIVDYSISSITIVNRYQYSDYGGGGNVGIVQERGGEKSQMMMTASLFRQDDDDDGITENAVRSENRDDSEAGAYSWARENILPLIITSTAVTTPMENDNTIIFWHIAKSGGTTAKAIYKCLLGIKNVSILSSRVDVLKAKELKAKSTTSFMGFASSPSAFTSSFASSSALKNYNVIFSMIPDHVATNLLSPTNKGRLVALFRHPVDRLISKFFYLQIATWEKGYKPHWKDKSLLTWAAYINRDNEHLVRTLAGKHTGDVVTELDFHRAKDTVRQFIFVGLTDAMEESIRRFNLVMGFNDNIIANESSKTSRGDGGLRMACMDEFFGRRDDDIGEENINNGMKKLNVNPHPTVKKGDLEWDILAEKNALDIQLYEYIVQLFEYQKQIIDTYYIKNSNNDPVTTWNMLLEGNA